MPCPSKRSLANRLTRRRWQRKHSDDQVRSPHLPMVETVRDGKLKIPIGPQGATQPGGRSFSRREKGMVSGRSCCWLDILLRTKATKGESEMKKAARGINPASKPSGDGCVECLESPRGWWLHLRRCAECGHIGCCDSSPSQHASKHAAATGTSDHSQLSSRVRIGSSITRSRRWSRV